MLIYYSFIFQSLFLGLWLSYSFKSLSHIFIMLFFLLNTFDDMFHLLDRFLLIPLYFQVLRQYFLAAPVYCNLKRKMAGSWKGADMRSLFKGTVLDNEAQEGRMGLHVQRVVLLGDTILAKGSHNRALKKGRETETGVRGVLSKLENKRGFWFLECFQECRQASFIPSDLTWPGLQLGS